MSFLQLDVGAAARPSLACLRLPHLLLLGVLCAACSPETIPAPASDSASTGRTSDARSNAATSEVPEGETLLTRSRNGATNADDPSESGESQRGGGEAGEDSGGAQGGPTGQGGRGADQDDQDDHDDQADQADQDDQADAAANGGVSAPQDAAAASGAGNSGGDAETLAAGAPATPSGMQPRAGAGMGSLGGSGGAGATASAGAGGSSTAGTASSPGDIIAILINDILLEPLITVLTGRPADAGMEPDAAEPAGDAGAQTPDAGGPS